MASDARDSVYSKLHFSSRDDAASGLAEYALAFVADRLQPSLLDLGCGSGSMSIRALTGRDDLSAVALDISAPNIASTRSAADRANVSDRLVAECADYMLWRGGPFDLIVSDGVLQLIEAGDADLARRLATDLKPNGYLIATMPFECWANSTRILLRRMWRSLPSATDRLAMAIAVRLHPEFSREFLAERLSYLRITPIRLLNDELVDEFDRQGLQLLEQAPWPSPSAAKLDHKLLVWQKR
jgi:trans-aconitate methyltransferase